MATLLQIAERHTDLMTARAARHQVARASPQFVDVAAEQEQAIAAFRHPAGEGASHSLCRAEHDDVCGPFHHPKSRTDPAAYERLLAASGVRGAWRTDLAIDDALAAADRVAAVNSTVILSFLYFWS